MNRDNNTCKLNIIRFMSETKTTGKMTPMIIEITNFTAPGKRVNRGQVFSFNLYYFGTICNPSTGISLPTVQRYQVRFVGVSAVNKCPLSQQFHSSVNMTSFVSELFTLHLIYTKLAGQRTSKLKLHTCIVFHENKSLKEENCLCSCLMV